MPNHEPTHKLPYTYRPGSPFEESNIFVVCQSADPKWINTIAWRLDRKDIKYLIHAGNAYPNMVELLKDAEQASMRAPNNSWLAEESFRITHLLREIGEAE